MTGLKTVSAGAAVLAALALAYFAVHARLRPSVNPAGASVRTIPTAPVGVGDLANPVASKGQGVETAPAALPGAAYAAEAPAGLTVENGTRIRGLARSIGGALGAQGIPVSRVGNFPVRPQMTTVLLFSSASREAAQALAKRLGNVPTCADPYATATVGMTLVIGLDYARFPLLAGFAPPATTPPSALASVPTPTSPTSPAAVVATAPATDAPAAQEGH